MSYDHLLEVQDLKVHFPLRRRGFGPQQAVRAVDGVSLHIDAGETVGLVGESGSGKSTTARAILRRVPITAGSVRFDGRDITRIEGTELRRVRRDLQLVYQDPFTSLNPKMKVRDIVSEPLDAHGIGTVAERTARVQELLQLTGLPPDAGEQLPHAFSGGQRQRIGIARALSSQPRLVVADEPVSALDVSIQAQIIKLLSDLQESLGVAFLFIAHDLSVVRHISHRIGIMYAGQIVEIADSESVFATPLHPYTESLLSASPIPDPEVERHRRRIVLTGEMPDTISPPVGCRFSSRCPYRQPDRCDSEPPELREVRAGHWAACHFAEEVASGSIPMRVGGTVQSLDAQTDGARAGPT